MTKQLPKSLQDAEQLCLAQELTAHLNALQRSRDLPVGKRSYCSSHNFGY